MDAEAINSLLITQCVLLLFGIVAGYFKLDRDKKFLQAQTASKITEIEQHLLKQTKLDHLKEQLSEFYGPIQMMLLTNKSLFDKCVNTDAWDWVRKHVLIPNNNSIAKILVHKINLLEGDEIPASFIQFIEHAYIWNVYSECERGFSKEYIDKQVMFPSTFPKDIEHGFRVVKQQYLTMIADGKN